VRAWEVGNWRRCMPAISRANMEGAVRTVVRYELWVLVRHVFVSEPEGSCLFLRGQGYLEMAGLLIEYGASITATDQYGKDAQDYAAASGYVDLAKVL